MGKGASASADRAAGLRPQPATPSSQSSIPSADECVSYIAQGYCSYVVEGWSKKRAEPLEVWLPALQSWVRADGFSIHTVGAGYTYPGLIGRARIKRAIRRFDAMSEATERLASAMSAGTAETRSGSGRQPASAVPEADAHD